MLNSTLPMQVFNLSGMYVGNDLNSMARGIYMVKQGDKMFKIRK
jgi:hypothetical protein